MGDNLYTEYWKGIMPTIITKFQEGQQTIQLPVTDLAAYGKRSSYYANFKIANGKLLISRQAYAQGRDLYAALIQEDYFKNNLKNRTLLINISRNLILRIELLSPDNSDNPLTPKLDKTPYVMSLNKIYYGPPGTGKTYAMQKSIKSMHLTNDIDTGEPDYSTFAEAYHWWQLLALALLDLKQTNVPGLFKHPLIQAKFNLTTVRSAAQRIWGTLQNHTVDDCPNVKLDKDSRHGEPVFYKEKNSIWRLNSEAEFRDQFAFLVEEYTSIKKTIKGTGKRHYTFTTCHQSLSYEDFIEGYKPVLVDDTEEEDIKKPIQYEIRKGYFYKACEKAAQRAGYVSLSEAISDTFEGRKKKFSAANEANQIHVLFLDEINRANISAVFGELITLLEEDKRLGSSNEIADVMLPYSQTLFGVPSNLYIIGTMNTADRSVEALDTALRRRFIFEEMRPNPQSITDHFAQTFLTLCVQNHHLSWEDLRWKTIEASFTDLIPKEKFDAFKDRQDVNTKKNMSLDEYKKYWDEVNIEPLTTKILVKLNSRIEVLLNSDHLIGHSYFLRKYTWEDVKMTFSKNIIPLLQEYFYGDYAKIGLIIGQGFFENEAAQLKNKENLFALFPEPDFVFDEEKPLFRLKDISQMSTDDFKKAISQLIN